MLALAIVLLIIALASPMGVPAFIVWLIGVGALGFWIGRMMAGEKPEVYADENR